MIFLQRICRKLQAIDHSPRVFGFFLVNCKTSGRWWTTKPACWRITNAMSNGQEETKPKSLEIGAGLRIQGITQVFRSLLIERAVSSLFLPPAVLAMAGCWMLLVGDWYENLYIYIILYVGSSRTS